MRGFAPDCPWRLDPGVTFLNHGSFGACPEPVMAARAAILEDLEANPMIALERAFEPRLDAARAEVAAFIGADPEGTVVVPNATAGVSTVLRSLRLRPGDELLTTDHEYNATLNALAAVADEARARVVRVSIPLPIRDPREVTEAILASVTPRTRLALVSHITSPSGLVFPIEDIVRELDRMGVDTLVDAAHAPGMVPLDVTALGAAYWTANGHKWLCGPKVCGVLVVRADRRDHVRPLITSHGANDPRADRPRLWREFDWPGTQDPSPFLTLPFAIRLLGTLHPDGWPGLMAENREAAVRTRRRLLEALGGEPIAPEVMLGSMASVALPPGLLATDDDAEALRDALATEERIEVPISPFPVPAARPSPTSRPSMFLVRVSRQRYVEDADVERLIEALARRGIGSGVPARAAAPAVAAPPPGAAGSDPSAIVSG
ncbi:MAG TPA: aminotransferase class V-fold PLP-dependent enzyme [Candidatus Limnocylindrales bacterium]|nr:aminotransferase class V-fold PLP-dependent enzyme [Candidatus Limnocylindrales bacterium]